MLLVHAGCLIKKFDKGKIQFIIVFNWIEKRYKVNHTKFLIITLPIALILAIIVLFLPENVSGVYVSIIEPLSLAVGGLLALRISFMYSKQLRLAFIYFAVFLFIYAAAIVFFTHTGDIISREIFTNLVVAVQAVDYLFLILFCICLLRVMEVGTLKKSAWIAIIATAVLCLFLALYPPVADGIISTDITIITYLIIRIIDAALVVALIPVIWLYVSYLQSQQRQSLTFTVIISGIICATIFNYLHETIVRLFASGAIESTPFFAVIPDALFIFGYLVIMTGLYAHLKDEQWGFNAVDRFMSGDLELIGDES